MNKKLFIAATITLGAITNYANAQNSDNEVKYRRSSMSLVLIEDDGMGKSKDMIIKSYENNPFPDKYNLHELKDKKFVPSNMKLTDQDYLSSGFYKDTLRKPLDFIKAMKNPMREIRYIKADSSEAIQEPSKSQVLQVYLDKYIRDKGLAKQIVSTWLNRSADGKDMNWDLIKERGMYSAAAETMDGADTTLNESLFMDWDLLSNTYTIFNKLAFYENEPAAALVRDIAKREALKKLAGKPDIIVQKAMEGLDAVYEKTKEGYTVRCTSFLYQLDYNEEVGKKVQAYFFNNNVDRAQAWDTTSIFQMKFVGEITSTSIVTFKLGEKRTEEQIIDLQIRRTMDNALAKLQKEYVQFRPVTVISSVEPLTARIGLKEGIEPGQTYEILASKENKMGIFEWESIGKVKVDKKAPIWDNRQGADQEPALDELGAPIVTPAFTQFSGGKNAVPEMNFIRLVK
jgi:hypothetical protein